MLIVSILLQYAIQFFVFLVFLVCICAIFGELLKAIYQDIKRSIKRIFRRKK